jgi:hypothetical protein
MMERMPVRSRKYPLKCETIQYIYTDSKHNNPLCKVTPVEDLVSLPPYDEEKYKEMILDAAETVLGFFGFDRTAYSNLKRINARKRRWYEEFREQRATDMETEML